MISSRSCSSPSFDQRDTSDHTPPVPLAGLEPATLPFEAARSDSTELQEHNISRRLEGMVSCPHGHNQQPPHQRQRQVNHPNVAPSPQRAIRGTFKIGLSGASASWDCNRPGAEAQSNDGGIGTRGAGKQERPSTGAGFTDEVATRCVTSSTRGREGAGPQDRVPSTKEEQGRGAQGAYHGTDERQEREEVKANCQGAKLQKPGLGVFNPVGVGPRGTPDPAAVRDVPVETASLRTPRRGPVTPGPFALVGGDR